MRLTCQHPTTHKAPTSPAPRLAGAPARSSPTAQPPSRRSLTEPQHRPDATEELSTALRERILVMDGAMGTMIQRHGISEEDYRGERFDAWSRDVRGKCALLSLSQPDVIRQIHTESLQAGA